MQSSVDSDFCLGDHLVVDWLVRVWKGGVQIY